MLGASHSERKETTWRVYRLVQQLKLDHGLFQTYFRMSVGQFEELMVVLTPRFRKQRSNFKEPMDPEQHFALCEAKYNVNTTLINT